MAIIKCKMCGGTIQLERGKMVATCEYCGTMQTVPSADSEKKLQLYSRANRYRMECDFDKATGIYEAIIEDFPDDAEAYWGLILCKFGIEYVDDPATGKKIPTCHRTSFTSILDDPDFDQVMDNSDISSRKLYQDEARFLEHLRLEILKISSNEKPYDIFICYKEADAIGNRTVDSVIAQDIYEMLTEHNYRVFFSRISLEDKLGQEYEPYIFAAINSAKIMLVVGTSFENYNSVWVKNEWSRYLKLMTREHDKSLIPCYKGIDAYDMPKVFRSLQAQDMGKIGAMQDLLYGIKKLLPQDQEPMNQITALQQGNWIHESLVKVKQFLSAADWKAASRCLNTILGYAPENVEALILQLMLDLKISNEEGFYVNNHILSENTYYMQALKLADSNTVERLKSLNKFSIYNHAIAVNEKSQVALETGIHELESISGWKDADIQADILRTKLNNLHKKYRNRKRVVLGAVACLILIIFGVIFKNLYFDDYLMYRQSLAYMQEGKYREASWGFQTIIDFRDSHEKYSESKFQYAQQKLANNDLDGAYGMFDYVCSIPYKADSCRLYMGKIRYMQGRFKEAKELFKEVTSTESQDEKEQLLNQMPELIS